MFGRIKKPVLTAGIVLTFFSILVTGCQSTVDDSVTQSHGSKAGDGYTYGTGPNKTKPYPQKEKVKLNGVGGARPKYEPVSRGGNKDYTVLGQNYMVWQNCSSYVEVGTASWYGPGFHGNKTSNGEVYDQRGYTAAHKNLPLPSYLKVTNLENGRAVIVRVNDRGPFHGSRIIDLSEGAARAIDMVKKGTAKVKIELIDVRNGMGNVADGGFGGNFGGGFGGGIGNSSNTGSNNNPIAGVINQVIQGAISNATSNSNNKLPQYNIDYHNPVNVADLPKGTAYVQFFSSISQQRASEIKQKLIGRTPFPIIIVAEEGFYRLRIGPIPESELQSSLEYMQQIGYRDSFIKRQL